MECPRCGEQLNEDARFCQRCGKSLLEQQIPDSPVLKKSNDSGMGILIGGLIVLALVICFALRSGDNNSIVEDSHVTAVKGGSPEAYPDITYGEAFESFFSNTSWKYFESDKGKDIVEFTGDCLYADTEVTATFQFELDMEDGTFEIVYLGFNDVPQSILIEYALISKAFESYD